MVVAVEEDGDAGEAGVGEVVAGMAGVEVEEDTALVPIRHTAVEDREVDTRRDGRLTLCLSSRLDHYSLILCTFVLILSIIYRILVPVPYRDLLHDTRMRTT